MNNKNHFYNRCYRNELNLDFQYQENYENQTNNQISIIMNKLFNILSAKKIKSVIFESRNDIYSIIGYRILKNLQGCYNFDIKVIGKSKKLNILKEEEFKRKDKNLFYISSFNPIYNVMNDNKYSNKLIKQKNFKPDFYIVNNFTPQQIEILCNFYKIKYENKYENNSKFNTFYQYCGDINNRLKDEYISNISNLKETVILEFCGGNEDTENIIKMLHNNKICYYKYSDKYNFKAEDIINALISIIKIKGIKNYDNIPRIEYNTYTKINWIEQE